MTTESGLGALVFIVAVLIAITGVGAMLLFASDALERWLDAPPAAEPTKERGAPSESARTQH